MSTYTLRMAAPVLLMAITAAAANGETLRVPADYATIQGAIDASVDGDEIIVAAGTYNEAINFNGKAIHLHSADGPDETTIDATGLKNSVVTCAKGEGVHTVLKGFTITGGYGKVDGYPYRVGGGIYTHGSSPTVTKCTIRGNSAGSGIGGGMYSGGGTPTVTDCTFRENSAHWGGGLYLESSPTVTKCRFSGNSAESGGGMYIESGTPTVTDCTFTKNWAWYGAGGGMCSVYGSPTVTDCTFTDNWAGYGYGGGMFTADEDEERGSTITKCFFGRNTADYGGGVCNGRGSPTFMNCTFVGNRANIGAGVANDTSAPTLVNCVFGGNTASIGGGMFNGDSSGPTLTNCILWGDTPNEISNDDVSAQYCDVAGGYAGAGNIDADPLFVRNPTDGGDGWGDNPDTPDFDESSNDDFGDLRLKSESPCIDAGDPAFDPPPGAHDLDGNARPWDGNTDGTVIVDMGAYEFGSHAYGDLNCDGGVDFNDIDAFVTALASREDYERDYPGCAYLLADVNADGLVDFGDIDPLVNCLIDGGCN